MARLSFEGAYFTTLGAESKAIGDYKVNMFTNNFSCASVFDGQKEIMPQTR